MKQFDLSYTYNDLRKEVEDKLESLFPGSQKPNDPSPPEGTLVANQYPRVHLRYEGGIREKHWASENRVNVPSPFDLSEEVSEMLEKYSLPKVEGVVANIEIGKRPMDLTLEQAQLLVKIYEDQEYKDAP